MPRFLCLYLKKDSIIFPGARHQNDVDNIELYSTECDARISLYYGS